jgi:hypothetical protein
MTELPMTIVAENSPPNAHVFEVETGGPARTSRADAAGAVPTRGVSVVLVEGGLVVAVAGVLVDARISRLALHDLHLMSAQEVQ